MDWTDRVRDLMRRREMTQLKLAEKSGYSAPGLNRLLNGKRGPSHESLSAIASALGTTVEYLMHGIDRPESSAQVSMVPMLADEQINKWQLAPDSIKEAVSQWIACPSSKAGMRTFAYRVSTDDMHAPAGSMSIAPGAIVYIDPDTNLDRGVTGLFLVNGQAVVREAHQIAGEWFMTPTNGKYQAIQMTGNAIFVGQVVGILQLP
ncbi:helix-turn-helix domain-containing protein [Kistimonas scapharcae]